MTNVSVEAKMATSQLWRMMESFSTASGPIAETVFLLLLRMTL
jgi:hypothetical protein